jgi:N-methylhydantoinase A
MLATDLRYELVRTHVGEVQKVGADTLRRIFGEMEADGRSRLEAFAGPVKIRRSADMRYGEQIFEITVPLDGVELDGPDVLEQVAARFHRRHEELYTYSAPDQEVVLVNLRVAVVGELPTLPAEPVRDAAGVATAVRQRRAYLGGWTDVPVFDLDRLPPGAEVKGPAIFESATTTVVIRDGDRATVTPHGWLDLILTGGPEMAPRPPARHVPAKP